MHISRAYNHQQDVVGKPKQTEVGGV